MEQFGHHSHTGLQLSACLLQHGCPVDGAGYAVALVAVQKKRDRAVQMELRPQTVTVRESTTSTGSQCERKYDQPLVFSGTAAKRVISMSSYWCRKVAKQHMQMRASSMMTSMPHMQQMPSDLGHRAILCLDRSRLSLGPYLSRAARAPWSLALR